MPYKVTYEYYGIDSKGNRIPNYKQVMYFEDDAEKQSFEIKEDERLNNTYDLKIVGPKRKYAGVDPISVELIARKPQLQSWKTKLEIGTKFKIWNTKTDNQYIVISKIIDTDYNRQSDTHYSTRVVIRVNEKEVTTCEMRDNDLIDVIETNIDWKTYI